MSLALSLVGCSSTSTPPLSTASLQVLGGSASVSPIDAYARIARGAHQCWFGSGGPLRATHIFHAEAHPPSKGGDVQITVHRRAYGKKSPLGLTVFRISINGTATNSNVVPQNLKMPEKVAELMTRDVNAWTSGKQTCSGEAIGALMVPTTAGIPVPGRNPRRPRK